VKNASGFQSWTVAAKNAEEALKKHKKGESDFEMEEVEVTGLGEAEVEEIEDEGGEP
jgi:hypothetical protein